MAEFRYVGPGPEEHDGEAVHPGDVRDFEQEPGWGLWERLDEPEPAAPAIPADGDKPEGGV